jgi:hypothetical protein
MNPSYTCVHGHRWQSNGSPAGPSSEGGAACPVCGAAPQVVTGDPSPWPHGETRAQPTAPLRPVAPRRKRWAVVIGLILLGGIALGVYGFLARAGMLEPAPANLPRFPLDDSGYFQTFSLVYRPAVKDPLSLEDLGQAYHHAGYRGAAQLEEKLRGGGLSPPEVMNALVQSGCFYLYEGDFHRAAETFEKARALAERDPENFNRILSTLMFLQGMAALRMGETENCVECACESSCVFPIRPSAVHQKREGSTRAVGFFTEYLRRHPDDIGVRWLLNIAYMTLGDYPGHVPPQYLIPLKPFESSMDIGRFRDIAPALGVNRLNEAGGAVMDDFDNDGLLDIVVSSMDPEMSLAYYRNKGDGTFEDRTKAAGLDRQYGGLYCVQTDYNNDGNLDLFVARGGWQGLPQRPSLLRNNGDGTFTDVTRQAGLLAPIDSQVAVWADYDNDGWLDLFLGGETVPSRLYHNKGDGTFEDVTEKAGIIDKALPLWGLPRCKGASWGDFDGDGYPDLYVNYNNHPPRLFHNNRDGTFTDVAGRYGIGQPGWGFACWFFDYDNDGWPDIFAVGYETSLNELVKSHLGWPHQGGTCRLYHNKNGQGFEDVTAAVGLDLAVAPMGCNFMDLDNDGYLDMYLGTGAQKYSLLVPNRMFKNDGGKRFVDITTSSGTGHLQKGHAVAAGDWDRDGNVDVFIEMGGGTPGDRFRNILWQNPGHANSWLTVKLVGVRTNRAAIGARIKVVPEGDGASTVYRHVNSGSSFGGNPLQQTIGLGPAKKVARLEVYWPTSGTTQVFTGVDVNRAVEVKEFAKDYRRLHWQPIRHSH